MSPMKRPPLALAFLLAPLAACDSSASGARPPVATLALAAGTTGTRVDTATVDLPLTLPAQLYVEHDAVMVARSAGMVDDLLVDLGTPVRAGQLLATIERTDQEIALDRANAAWDNASRVLARARTMAGFGGMTAADSEQAEFAARDAAIALRKAQRDVELTRIVAPFTGVVTVRYARPRRYVAVGETLFRVTERGPLLARVRVPERAAGAARVGDTARVLGDAGGAARARVVRVAPALDAASGTREMVLQLTEGARLLPGANVRVLLGSERRRAIVVPREAVSADGWALVIEPDGRSSLRAVTLGAELSGGRVEVLSGLAPGERVARPER